MDVSTILGWGVLYGMQAAQIGLLFMMAVKHMDWESVDHHLTLKQCRSMDKTFIIEMALHLGFCLLLAIVAPPMAFALFALHVPLVSMPVRRFMEGRWRVEPEALWKQGPQRKKELYVKGLAQTALLVGTIATMMAAGEQ